MYKFLVKGVFLVKTRTQFWREILILAIWLTIFFVIGYFGSKLFVSGITTEEVPFITISISIKENTNINTFCGWLLSVCSYFIYLIFLAILAIFKKR